MRYYPTDEYDKKDMEELHQGVELWKVYALKMNPSYCSWGNGEDCMWKDGDNWDSSLTIDSIEELWELDEYNELINFYFQIEEETNKLQLQMWIIHPRKGASRGLLLTEIQNEEELKTCVEYLKGARDRNLERFSKL